MSKLSNTLLMLFTLQKGGMHSIRDLSELLEVTPRQVRRYRYDLEKSGIFVHSKTGKHGGYYLDEEHKVIPINASMSETGNLFATLFQDEQGINVRDIAAMHALCLKDVEVYHETMRQSSIPAIKAAIVMQYALRERRQVNVRYVTKKHARVLERTLEPYMVFSRFNVGYLAAVDVNDRQMKYYRLSGMQGFAVLDQMFEVDEALCEKHRQIVEMNHGVFYQGEWIDVELTCTPEIRSVIGEMFDDKVSFEEGESMLSVKLTVGSEREIFHRLLGFGSSVTVVKPQSLAKRLKAEHEKAAANYA